MSRDLGRRRQGLGTTTSDLDLRASDVELGWRAGVVDTELLHAEEVLAWGDARRNGDRVCGCVHLLAQRIQDHGLGDGGEHIPAMSHFACPPLKAGPISLIFAQSVLPSAEAALSTLVM